MPVDARALIAVQSVVTATLLAIVTSDLHKQTSSIYGEVAQTAAA